MRSSLSSSFMAKFRGFGARTKKWLRIGGIPFRVLGFALVGTLCSLIACGGGGGGTQAAGATASVVVNVAAEEVYTGESLAVNAQVTGLTDKSITWTVDNILNGNSNVGTISGSNLSVTYTAPENPGTYLVVGTSVASNTSDSRAIRVVKRTVTITLVASSTTIFTGGTSTLTATISGVSNTAVTWDVDGVQNGNSTVGTITGTGNIVTYTAPPIAGSHVVKATSVADTTKSAPRTITVLSVPTIDLAPATTTARVGGAVSLTASVSGLSNSAVVWAVDGVQNGDSTVGTITGTGNIVTYTAPMSPGIRTVTATSVVDATKIATATIHVHYGCAPDPASSQVVNVRNALYGAVGDGVKDDTAAIQKAINATAGTGGTTWIPAGTYLVDAVQMIRLGSNMTLRMDSGAVLKAKPNSANYHVILLVKAVSGVNIVNGTLAGERDNHTGAATDQGQAGLLNIVQSSAVVVEGITAKDGWGDGIYVGEQSRDITFCSVIVDNNRRQGMSLTSVDGTVIKDSIFRKNTGYLNISGVRQCGAGLNLEPNVGETVNNTRITGCTFSDNWVAGLSLTVPSPSMFVIGTVAEGNTITGNGVGNTACPVRGVFIDNVSGTVFTNNIVSNNYGCGVYLTNGSSNSIITGNTITGTLPGPNAAFKAYGEGILLYLTQGNMITGNTVTSNAGGGICDAYPVGSNTINSNTLSGNGTCR